jgi:hypothetical protein
MLDRDGILIATGKPQFETHAFRSLRDANGDVASADRDPLESSECSVQPGRF